MRCSASFTMEGVVTAGILVAYLIGEVFVGVFSLRVKKKTFGGEYLKEACKPDLLDFLDTKCNFEKKTPLTVDYGAEVFIYLE